MPQDFYEVGAENEAAKGPESLSPKKEEKGPSTAMWAIGIGVAAFIGLPILLNSLTDLVKASKE
jgi:hypothetical protein